MPTFIKRKCVLTQKKGREVNTYPDWTGAELAELREKLPSRFITVTESHAHDVLRPQEKYQEVVSPVSKPRSRKRKA